MTKKLRGTSRRTGPISGVVWFTAGAFRDALRGVTAVRIRHIWKSDVFFYFPKTSGGKPCEDGPDTDFRKLEPQEH